MPTGCSEMCTAFLGCKSPSLGRPTGFQLGSNQVSKGAKSSFYHLWTLCWLANHWCTRMHGMEHCLASVSWTFWMMLASSGTTAWGRWPPEIAVFRVHFQSIFHLKWFNQFTVDNTSPYHYPSPTLLVFQSNWCAMSVSNPAMGPPIRSIQCHSHLIHPQHLWKICLHVMFSPILDAFACVYYLREAGFLPFWPCQSCKALCTLCFCRVQEGCSSWRLWHVRPKGSWILPV